MKRGKPSISVIMPTSVKHHTAEPTDHHASNMYSPKSNSSNKVCLESATQQFYSVLEEEKQIAKNKFFLGCQLRRKPLPYTNKINFINRSNPKHRLKLNNLSNYLMNTIKQKFNTTNRFKATDRTTSLKEIALKDKRLMQICADIQAFHELERLDDLSLHRSDRLRQRIAPSPLQMDYDMPQLPNISHKIRQLTRPVHFDRAKESTISPPNSQTKRLFGSKKENRQRLRPPLLQTYRVRPIKTEILDVGPWEIAD